MPSEHQINPNERTEAMNHTSRIIVISFCLLSIALSSVAYAVEDIQTEFDALCGIMQEADGYSLEELQALIVRTDALIEQVQNSDHPRKKVILFRLAKCKNFFEFLIETKH